MRKECSNLRDANERLQKMAANGLKNFQQNQNDSKLTVAERETLKAVFDVMNLHQKNHLFEAKRKFSLVF